MKNRDKTSVPVSLQSSNPSSPSKYQLTIEVHPTLGILHKHVMLLPYCALPSAISVPAATSLVFQHSATAVHWACLCRHLAVGHCSCTCKVIQTWMSKWLWDLLGSFLRGMLDTEHSGNVASGLVLPATFGTLHLDGV